jgi:hypothetical protein
MTTRFVRKERRVYDFSLCRLCGSAGGCSAPRCSRAVCLACGTPQCHSNGLGNGTCGVCYVGLLPGWSGSDRPCGYKGCGERAVARAPRVGLCCRQHMQRAGVLGKVTAALMDRAKRWDEVNDDGSPAAAAPAVPAGQMAELKARHPGVLLVFRFGGACGLADAYGLADDGHAAEAQALGVPRLFGGDDLEACLRTLLRAGRRVAICDQVGEAPRGTRPERAVLPGA